MAEARSKVKVSYPDGWPRRYMSGTARVELKLKDGKKLSKELEQSYGGPMYPLTPGQNAELYRKYAREGLSEEHVERTLAILMNLEEVRDIQELVDVLTFRHAL